MTVTYVRLVTLLTSSKFAVATALLLSASLVPAVGSAQTEAGSGAGATRSRCEAFEGTRVAARDMTIASRGAVIESATWQAPESSEGLPERCELQGRIRMLDREAPDINFQVNLPTAWNRGSVQYGGSGFNGTLVTGLDNIPGSNGGPLKPITRGYATYGDDGGTATTPSLPGYFGLNPTALRNYGGQAVKRTTDVAQFLITKYYGEATSRKYFAGGSKGGQEGLVAAQRFASDYDGVIAYYPANQNQAMVFAWRNIENQATGLGAGFASSVTLVNDAVYAHCDKLDGLTDGVIANVRGCNNTFNIESLVCPVDAASVPGVCLSKQQATAFSKMSDPFRLAYAIQDQKRSIGGFPYLDGAPVDAVTLGLYRASTEGVLRFFDRQRTDDLEFDHRDYKRRVKQLSRILDATDPNLDEFMSRGGKLIMVQGTVDTLVAPKQTHAYFESLRYRYGADLSDSVRYFVQPGFDHIGVPTAPFVLSWDSLTALERWESRDRAPVSPIATSLFNGNRMPLCEYPAWPRYEGGDASGAAAFRCVDAAGANTKTRLNLSSNTWTYGKAATATLAVIGRPRVTGGLFLVRDNRKVVARRAVSTQGTAKVNLSKLLRPGVHRLTVRWLPAGFPARVSTSRRVVVRVDGPGRAN